MDTQRVEFSAPQKAAEILHLQELYAVAEQAYKNTFDEWDRAVTQARAWHNYEQKLVSQCHAMNSTLLNLKSAIRAIEEMSSEMSGQS